VDWKRNINSYWWSW